MEGQIDKPKVICPLNFFNVEGIKSVLIHQTNTNESVFETVLSLANCRKALFQYCIGLHLLIS